MHEDPVTKAKRVTDSSGSVVSAVEFDPYGAEAGGANGAFQPRKFTSYERDANGTDEAMLRRYNRWHARFDQPDPADGSYDLSDPQSLNRYAYVRNDPVNFVDPTGLDGDDGFVNTPDDPEVITTTSNTTAYHPRGPGIHRRGTLEGTPGEGEGGGSSSRRIPPDCYRGRIQGQGERPKVEESVPWANSHEEGPPDRYAGLDMLNKLWDKLSKSERRERQGAYNDAVKWIMSSPPQGRPPMQFTKSFQDPRRRDPHARIDIQIFKGNAFGDTGRMPLLSEEDCRPL